MYTMGRGGKGSPRPCLGALRLELLRARLCCGKKVGAVGPFIFLSSAVAPGRHWTPQLADKDQVTEVTACPPCQSHPKELKASNFFRRPSVEVFFVSLASGIPSRACWLGEPGALSLLGMAAMFPKHSRIKPGKVLDWRGDGFAD